MRQRRPNPNIQQRQPQPPSQSTPAYSPQIPAYSPNPYSQPQQPTPPQQSSTAGLTIQQVIDIYGKRLILLENFMQQSQNNTQQPPQNISKTNTPPNNPAVPLAQMEALVERKMQEMQQMMSQQKPQPQPQTQQPAVLDAEIITEYNNRFEILAEELAELKNVVLFLQNYTMTVNKQLLERTVPDLFIPAATADETTTTENMDFANNVIEDEADVELKEQEGEEDDDMDVSVMMTEQQQ